MVKTFWREKAKQLENAYREEQPPPRSKYGRGSVDDVKSHLRLGRPHATFIVSKASAADDYPPKGRLRPYASREARAARKKTAQTGNTSNSLCQVRIGELDPRLPWRLLGHVASIMTTGITPSRD